MPRLSAWTRSLPLALALVACGDDPPAPRVAERITAGPGSGQSAAAGTLLPAPVTFVVSDRQGPLSGVTVTFSLGDPTGFLAPGTAVTGPDGTVSTRWTVGGTLGQQTLTATVAGLAPATATAAVAAGPPAIVSIVSNPSQFVVVGRLVASPPSVRVTDAFSNPVTGISVTFEDQSGETVITGGQQTSDANGLAAATSWRIPNRMGTFTLTASAAAASAVFAAFAVPARFELAAGAGQSANTGTELVTAPAVLALDEADAPLRNAVVTFRITAGGGFLLGSDRASTGPDGVAAAPGWVLGPEPGLNRLEAEVAGIPAVRIDATGVVAQPGVVDPISPTGQTAFFRNFTTARPTVRVTDAGGRPVAGAPVTFAVTSGGGAIRGESPLTDFRGEASLGSWRLGQAGAQSVEARVGSLAPVGFTATGGDPPPSAYRIDVRFVGPAPSASRKAAFENAAARWSSLILNDLGDEIFTPAISMDGCGNQPLDETVDDLVIFAEISPIDGLGGILGQAGPCYLRDDNLLSVVGYMQFDSDDVQSLENTGQFGAVVLHEMGHVLGVGSLWPDLGLLQGRLGGDPFFTGPSARQAFVAAASSGFEGNAVPVENTGGPGTRDSHWRESVFGNELMTGFIDAGSNPLSAVTAASLRDEGYLVDDAQSDPFSFLAAVRAVSGTSLRLEELPWALPIRTVSGGAVRRILFRPRR